MLVNPFLKTTKTLLAPQRRAEVAQSKAVSPAPSTMTLPCRLGREFLQEHIAAGREGEREGGREREGEGEREGGREGEREGGWEGVL